MESTGTAMNYIALQQAIQGKMIMIGGDLFTGTAKPKLYDTFYHPHLLIGMPGMGGDVKVYIDTRFEGHYVMTAAVKLDPWANGPSK